MSFIEEIKARIATNEANVQRAVSEKNWERVRMYSDEIVRLQSELIVFEDSKSKALQTKKNRAEGARKAREAKRLKKLNAQKPASTKDALMNIDNDRLNRVLSKAKPAKRTEQVRKEITVEKRQVRKEVTVTKRQTKKQAVDEVPLIVVLPRAEKKYQKVFGKYYQKNATHVDTAYLGKKALPKQMTLTQTVTQYRKDYGYTFPTAGTALRELIKLSLNVVNQQQPLSNLGIIQMNQIIRELKKIKISDTKFKDEVLRKLIPYAQKSKQNQLTTQQLKSGDAKFAVKASERALRGFVTSTVYRNIANIRPLKFLELLKAHYTREIPKTLGAMHSLKVRLTAQCTFIKDTDQQIDDESLLVSNEVWIQSETLEVFHADQVPTIVDQLIKSLMKSIEKWAKEGSGFILQGIIEARMNYSPNNPRPAGSWIRVCPYIYKNKSIINQKNYDEECFGWASIVCLHHQDIKEHKERVTLYKKYVKELNFEGISFPVEPTPSLIQKIEGMNPGYKWNVFSFNEPEYNLGHMDNSIEIVYTSKSTDPYVKVMNLLYYETEEGSHYMAIVGNLSNIFPKYKTTKDGKTRYMCENCVSFHTLNKELLHKHQELCFKNKCQMVRMPSAEKDKY
jgi:hypothetical protein